jgi:hypothetical protein
MKGTLIILATALLGLTLGCEPDRVAGLDGPGALELRLVSLNSDDGAIVVSLRGGPIDSITGIGIEAAAVEFTPGAFTLLLRGTIRSGAIARVWVPEVGDAAAYDVAVVQAASRDTYVRRDTREYAVSLDRGS